MQKEIKPPADTTPARRRAPSSPSPRQRPLSPPAARRPRAGSGPGTYPRTAAAGQPGIMRAVERHHHCGALKPLEVPHVPVEDLLAGEELIPVGVVPRDVDPVPLLGVAAPRGQQRDAARVPARAPRSAPAASPTTAARTPARCSASSAGSHPRGRDSARSVPSPPGRRCAGARR